MARMKISKQSPWADAPEDNRKAELQDRLKHDRNLHMDILQGDEAYFASNPRRTFRVRSASPQECCGGGDGWMLIAKARGRKYGHFLIPGIDRLDASKHDSDEVGRYLFDCLTQDCTAKNTDPSFFEIIKEIRGRR